MSNILLQDVRLAFDEFVSRVVGFKPDSSLTPADFWVRTVVRCFTGFIDGIAFAMRRAVMLSAKDVDLTLSPKEEADLKKKRLPPLKSLKLAFQTFPLLFGADYRLNTGGEEWLGLQRIFDFRNKLTHPRVLEDLLISPSLPALLPSMAWVAGEMQSLFGEIDRRLGRSPRPVMPDVRFPELETARAPRIKFFSDEDYDLVKSYGSRTLEYVKRMFFLLNEDTKVAIDLLRGAYGRPALVLSPKYQFAARVYARTLFSEVEGATAAARFFIEAAVTRGTVVLSESDKMSFDEGEVEDRFVAAVNLWAREFGNDYHLAKSGIGWTSMRGARAFRNRITHPKSLSSFRVNLGLVDELLNAHGFFVEGWGEGLYLHEEKWFQKAEGIDVAIAEAVEEEKRPADLD